MEAEIVVKTQENFVLNGTKNDVLHSQQSTMVTEVPSSDKKSKVTSSSPSSSKSATDGADLGCFAGDSKSLNSLKTKSDFPMKNKRKRRRGKPKSNIKPYKKSNWKFQKPRCHQQQNGGGGGGTAGAPVGSCNGMRTKLVRSRSIVPYNTNDFLMEEHLAEVPSALLTPSGRTRDSSFSVDSEDNYFFSLPDDEEEFLTKEFANVYERARVERLESLNKQQLIEECLQLEDRYAQGTGAQQQSNGTNDFINKIRGLEERIRDLNAENLDLRRKLDYRQGAIKKQERMCSSTSEDSESDSSSSSSSCASSDFSRNSRHSSLSDERNDESPMDSDDIVTGADEQQQQQIAAAAHVEQTHSTTNQSEIMCNGHATLSPASRSPRSPINPNVRSPAQQIVVNSAD